ncbi:histidine kinase dimerization/phosphoacceptor domain -containing protein [Arenibacter palladensis]|uniref:histidine kinase dimerization/phosphoacceptor domain -containing protein n=1 Tax=Arenibacter palladensis TaxID=237373 RepID=UPI0026E24F53|nr:histidine kinase dimerization/phosphoacceptor domain -containing protein [Arenibacter palladensis]MDO6604781.1 histidine kinase dimerization/phosphoacceptor domain -containing protein [Arenibacter palladensis]
MGKHYFIAIFIFFLGSPLLLGQLIDFDRDNPYEKVFVDTDNFGASYLQQLEDLYVQAPTDSLQFEILNDLAYYWHTRNLIKALNFTEEGLKCSLAKGDMLWHGRFQITQGAILLRMEKLDKAQEVLEEAKAKVQTKDLPFLNTQLGYVYERRGQLAKAADYALEGLQLGEELNDKKAIALAYSDLSNIFWKQAKYDKGLKYGIKSVVIFEERGIIDLDYDFTLYVVANNFLKLNRYEEALKYYEHSLAIGERYGFYNNLSDVYISLVDLYAYLGKYRKAESAGLNAVKYATYLDNDFMLMRSWLSIGKLQNLQGKYKYAIESLQKSLDVATAEFGDEYYLSQVYEALGKAYAGNHDYMEAYKAFSKYDGLKKEIFTAESDQRIALLQTEFEVAQKEDTILMQQGTIRKQKSNQMLTSIITGLLLFLLIVGFVAIRINRRKNKLLQQQNQEKEFLIKEIHHRVKNNLEVVSSLLSLQSSHIGDKKIKDNMLQIQNRIQSMSMIHQNLYQGKNLGSIEMKNYFNILGDYVLQSYGTEQRIVMVYDMEELELNVDIATPIGLIVNELITNSLKYAFPNNLTGVITIRLVQKPEHLELTVTDNGVGIQKGKELSGTGFGTQLITLLTKQLDGKMVLLQKKGTSVSFEFQNHKAA